MTNATTPKRMTRDEALAELHAQAKARHPRSTSIIGTLGGNTEKRRTCYVCDEVVSTYCGQYRETVRSRNAVARHLESHIAGLMGGAE